MLSLFVFAVSHFFFDNEKQYPRPYNSVVNYYGAEYGVDSNLVYAIMKQESNFSPEAVSSKGAVGLMQLMPDTASWAAEKEGISYDESKLTDPKYSLRLSIWFLGYLNDIFNDDTSKVIAAYNAGDGSVNQWLKEGSWDGTVENANSIPFAETANYVEHVWENYEKYQEIY